MCVHCTGENHEYSVGCYQYIGGYSAHQSNITCTPGDTVMNKGKVIEKRPSDYTDTPTVYITSPVS